MQHGLIYILQAVWRDKFGSVSYYLKLIEQSDKSLKYLDPSSNHGSPGSSGTTQAAGVTVTEASEVRTRLLEKYKSEILANSTLPLLTLFTSWNDSPSKSLIHNVTAKNWLTLKPYVIPVLFTNETALAAQCAALGWEVLPVPVEAAGGVPVLKYMYKEVMDRHNTSFYAFANGDIIFTDKLMDTLISVLNTTLNLSEPTLIVGQRTNVKNFTLEEGITWTSIAAVAKQRGKLFTGWAEDYFITPRSYPWHDMPEVVIGRRAYDNWLVYNARKSKYNVIDVTRTLLAVHQTDEAGNFEGHHHQHGDYNHNLLVKLYKRIKYNAGVIECIERFAVYDKGEFVIKAKTLPKACTV